MTLTPGVRNWWLVVGWSVLSGTKPCVQCASRCVHAGQCRSDSGTATHNTRNVQCALAALPSALPISLTAPLSGSTCVRFTSAHHYAGCTPHMLTQVAPFAVVSLGAPASDSASVSPGASASAPTSTYLDNSRVSIPCGVNASLTSKRGMIPLLSARARGSLP